MKKLGKIKIEFGGGFNLLCLVAAGKIAIDAYLKLDAWSRNEKDRQALKDACEAVKTIDEIVTKLDKVTIAKED